jgi:hypothetical protein
MDLKKTLLPALLMIALAACDKTGNNGAPAADQPAATPTPASTAAPAATEQAAPEQAAPAATADADDSKIGIAECDDYISKVKACLAAKVPEAQRAMFDQAMKTSADQWKAAMAQPGGKEALAAQCKQASDAAKQTYASFGCDM